MKIKVAALLVLAWVALVAQGAAAQDFPTRPVHLIVPNAPAGAIDIMARLFSRHLQALWGQAAVVEYKPGAGTALGTDYVAKSPADGYTLGFVATPHVINPSLRKLPFDTVRDLSGVSLYAVSNIVIVATPGLPANTLPEFIALAKANPGKYTYASPGSGSSMHLAMELLKQAAGIDLLHVPFKGSGPAYPEVFAGRVDLLVDPLFASLPYIKAGRTKPIAVTSAKRAAQLPEVQTVAETVPGFEVQSFFGIVVPSATPRAIVNKLNADVVKVLRLPEMRAKLSELGLEPVGDTPEQFDATICSEIDKWARVVKEAGIKAD